MNDFTIISYPGHKDNSLLSLIDNRSRYMLPFGGRFRVVDFTIRNSFRSGARHTIIYTSETDGLEEYVNLYGPFSDPNFPPLRVVSREYSDIKTAYSLVMDSNTDYYIIYNGDNPSIIDFKEIVGRFRSKKTDAMLFGLDIDGRPSMAYKILVTNQKTLLNVINQAIDEDRHSPNIFEMIINIMVNTGIAKSHFHARYWPVKTVPDYYNLSREVIWDPEIFGLLYKEKIIKSQIKAEGYAHLGTRARVSGSFVSDFCDIDGTVENSIIYPGVQIGRNSVIKNSIILPYVRIGANARITKCIVDESRPLGAEEESFLNVEDNCRIGSSDEFIKNNEFPRFLFDSITLIGRDCRLPEGAGIGGGCYISPGIGPDSFAQKKFLYDGMSLTK